ncbi:MAG: lipoprotein [Novosphingobium sp.]|uniref:lipoprotein n=1 Tax=Novosphingobium sp. TaxID=1874826 RepID=UPI0032B9BB38
MKKIALIALAGSALMLAGCGQKEEAATAEATPVAETSAEAVSSDAATATDAAQVNETTNGGTVKP